MYDLRYNKSVLFIYMYYAAIWKLQLSSQQINQILNMEIPRTDQNHGT